MATKKVMDKVSEFVSKVDAAMALKQRFVQLETELNEYKKFFREQAKVMIGVGETSILFASSIDQLNIRVTIPGKNDIKFKEDVKKIPPRLLQKFFVKTMEPVYTPIESFEKAAETDLEILDWVEIKPRAATVTIP